MCCTCYWWYRVNVLKDVNQLWTKMILVMMSQFSATGVTESLFSFMSNRVFNFLQLKEITFRDSNWFVKVVVWVLSFQSSVLYAIKVWEIYWNSFHCMIAKSSGKIKNSISFRHNRFYQNVKLQNMCISCCHGMWHCCCNLFCEIYYVTVNNNSSKTRQIVK